MIQEPTLFHGTQLDIDATNPTLPSGSFFSQLLQVNFSFHILFIIKLYVILKISSYFFCFLGL